MLASTTFTSTFEVRGTSGALQNADSLPTASVYRNGVLTVLSVTVANLSTGVYQYSFSVPAWNTGDAVDVHVSATVDSFTLSDKISKSITETGADNATLTLIQKYHDNTVKFFESDGTTETTQANAVRMTVYDNDGTTPLKTVEFRNSTNNPVTLGNATRYVKL